MPVTCTEVFVDLKCPPLQVFDRIAPEQSNYFRFRLSPDVVISTGARVKKPGEAMRGENVELMARIRQAWTPALWARAHRGAARGHGALLRRGGERGSAACRERGEGGVGGCAVE